MDTNIAIYTTIKKSHARTWLEYLSLHILNTNADVREHRFYRYRAIRLE